MPTTPLRWSHKQGVAYECAKECMTDLMALCSERIAAEGARPEPDEKRVRALEADLLAMGCERRELGLFEAEHIAEIRDKYGAWIAAQARWSAMARQRACADGRALPRIRGRWPSHEPHQR